MKDVRFQAGDVFTNGNGTIIIVNVFETNGRHYANVVMSGKGGYLFINTTDKPEAFRALELPLPDYWQRV